MFQEYSLQLGAVAALGYSLAALFTKSALQQGCGILRFSFICNLVFVLFFGLLLYPGIDLSANLGWELPILAGSLFFLGQVLTFSAIRVGDISIQTPIMGSKAVFVTIIAASFSLGDINLMIWIGAICSCFAVALLGFSGKNKSVSAPRPFLSVLLSLASALAFAGSDVMVSTFSSNLGKHNFLFITMLTNGALSFLLIPFFKGPVLKMPRKAAPFIVLGSLGMAMQALLLNYTLASSERVAEINILYSTRGFWSLLLALFVGSIFFKNSERLEKKLLAMRIIGCLLMSLSVLAVFS